MEVEHVAHSHGRNGGTVGIAGGVAGGQHGMICEINDFQCLLAGQRTGGAAKRPVFGGKQFLLGYGGLRQR